MYERVNGTARITNALRSILGDPRALSVLAKELRYVPEQLSEDIKALSDTIDELNERREEDTGK